MQTDSLSKAIDSREALVEAICTLVDQAQYQLDIFSRELPRDIFSVDPVVSRLRQWTVNQPRARVRVFVHNAQTSMLRGNALIELGLHLTSYFSFREPAPLKQYDLRETVLVDGRNALVWSAASNLNATIISQPAEVTLRQKDFDFCWNHGQPSRQIRNLYL